MGIGLCNLLTTLVVEFHKVRLSSTGPAMGSILMTNCAGAGGGCEAEGSSQGGAE